MPPWVLGVDAFERTPRLSALRPAVKPRRTPLFTPALEPYVDITGAPIAHFRYHRRWFRRPELRTVTPKMRNEDDATVLVVELDNFGDIGSSPLFPPPLSPIAFVVLPVGGLASLWFGVKPAIEDIVEGVRNIGVLREEAKVLRREIADDEAQIQSGRLTWGQTHALNMRLRGLRTRLSLSLREQRGEVVDRVVAGSLIAPGSLLTAMGTFATPGFIAAAGSVTANTMATLLTGLVGNAPVALYGVVNAAFHGHRAWAAHSRLRVLRGHSFNHLWRECDVDVDALLQGRQRLIRNVAGLKALCGLGIGAGGIATAFSPIGYAVLLPFAALRASVEYFGQKKVTYSRRIYDGTIEDFEPRALVTDLIYCNKSYDLLKSLKRQSRRRHPWGVQAPVPFNWAMRGVAAARCARLPPDPSVEEQIYAFLRGHTDILVERLQRDVRGAVADDLQIRAGASADLGGMAWPFTELSALDDQLKDTAKRLRRAIEDQDSLKTETPDDLHNNPLPWIARLLTFFSEAHLWPELALAIHQHPDLAPSLGPAVLTEDLDGKPGLRMDANAYIAALRGPMGGYLRDPNFVSTFYEVVDKQLMTVAKQQFQDLQRELMDMITTQTVDHERENAQTCLSPSTRPVLNT